MPTTTERQFIITAKQTGGSAGQSTLSFTNGRTGQSVHLRTLSNEIKTNLGDEKVWTQGFADNDRIGITGTGIKTGYTSVLIDPKKGGALVTLTMTDASTTNAPAVTIG